MNQMLLQHPVISRMERTGYPDGITPQEPRCPECGSECWEVFATDEALPQILGCDCCMEKLDAYTTPECYTDIAYQENPCCPECGCECDTVYRMKDSRQIVGCQFCVMPAEPGLFAECF